ncbi:MAG: START domain-containing protein [Crocinitomicaceae bacterium]
MRIVAAIVFLLAFNSYGADWVLDKNKDGIKVYTREIPGSDFKEYKGVAFVNASRERVAEVVLRISDYINWFPDCMESKRLKVISPTELIVYYVIDSPWPIKDRDAVVRMNIKDLADKQTILIDFEAATGFKDEVDGIVRVPKSSGYWKFISSGEGTKVIYQNHADPGGSVPAWVVNMFVVDAPFETLSAIRTKISN